MQAIDGPNGELYLKIDRRNHRFLILPAARKSYVASGWIVKSKTDFDAALDSLNRAGVATEGSSPTERSVRKVQDFFSFKDPAGNRHEISSELISDFTRFVSPIGVSKFITGELGMGHTVLPAQNIQDTLDFLVQHRRHGAVRHLIASAYSGFDGPTLFHAL